MTGRKYSFNKKPHVTTKGIKNLKCFNQVSSVIGEKQAVIELRKVLLCHCGFENYYLGRAFYWDRTPQGFQFWISIASEKRRKEQKSHEHGRFRRDSRG